MDKMDRMLRALPHETPSPELASIISRAVRRRHRRRQVARRMGASLLALFGLWLVSPGLAWLSSGELYASGAPWMLGVMDYLNSGSVEMVNRLWNGTFSIQSAIGSSLAFSIWLGALMLCCAIFLALDLRALQPLSGSREEGGSSTMLASSLHI